MGSSPQVDPNTSAEPADRNWSVQCAGKEYGTFDSCEIFRFISEGRIVGATLVRHPVATQNEWIEAWNCPGLKRRLVARAVRSRPPAIGPVPFSTHRQRRQRRSFPIWIVASLLIGLISALAIPMIPAEFWGHAKRTQSPLDNQDVASTSPGDDQSPIENPSTLAVPSADVDPSAVASEYSSQSIQPRAADEQERGAAVSAGSHAPVVNGLIQEQAESSASLSGGLVGRAGDLSRVAGMGVEPGSELGLTSASHSQKPLGRLVTESGRTIELGKIFARERDRVESRLKAAQSTGTLLRFNYDQSTRPFLWISRRGSMLHGPQASFYEDGSPSCLVGYTLGKRSSVLMTWDPKGRPLLFEQYERGEKHGWLCLHKACSEQCTEGHLWLVQQWRRGHLLASHLIPEDGKARTFEHEREGSLPTSNPFRDELDEALAIIAEQTEQLASNEQTVVESLANFARVERARASMIRRQLALVSYPNQRLSIRRCRGGG